jgi:myo-inositol-1(or 4)-monophosphatase
MSELRDVLALAEHLALAAGAIQRERYETDVRIDTKSAPIDLVTEVDRACEALIVETLRKQRPRDAVLAEEGSGRDDPHAEWRWIIDPLDGTTNYAHGYPRFCVSIGVEHRGVRSAAAVFDPLLRELYTAQRGEGAFLDGRRLQVSEEAELGRALVATGFAYDVRHNPDDNLDHFSAFVKNARAVRRDGSAALDLCYVAAGRFDGFWELQLHPWDVAAGFLIVEEAGGRVSDRAGGPPPRTGRDSVASNGRIHEAMLALLRRR